MNGIQIGQTSHTSTSSTMYSVYYPDLAEPIGRCRSSFSSSALEISEQHSREGNELYLFVGSVLAIWVGLATVRHVFNAMSELGGI
jgi:hypothetical protein